MATDASSELTDAFVRLRHDQQKRAFFRHPSDLLVVNAYHLEWLAALQNRLDDGTYTPRPAPLLGIPKPEVAFHYFLWACPILRGNESAFTEIRAFISDGTGNWRKSGSRPVPKLGPAGIDERTAPLEIRRNSSTRTGYAAATNT